MLPFKTPLPSFQSRSFPIADLNEVGNIRRQAMAASQMLHFNETEMGKVSIVATELASNLAKHAAGGEILLRSVHTTENNGLEIIAIDKGSGMANIERCMQDGYSTAGSAGIGLGAVNRLSTHLDIYSQVGKGTVMVCSLWAKPFKASTNLEMGIICRPIKGEQECGDSWAIHYYSHGIKMIVVDGLGHGPQAAEASLAAITAFEHNVDLPSTQLMQVLHGALLSTRGAAVMIADINLDKEELRCVGVGNISSYIIQGLKAKGLTSYNGTVGHQMHKIQEFVYSCPANSSILFHTDGLSERWKIEDYPGLFHRHPSLIAGVLYRDFQRIRDDATILSLRT